MAGIHVKFEITPEALLAELTEVAYRVALRHGLHAPFVEVELDMQQALKDVMAKNMMVSEACGESEACRSASRFSPWSKEAEEIIKADTHEIKLAPLSPTRAV